MPTPELFPEANVVLGPPKGVSDEECGTLPVRRNGETLVSCWRLSPAEIEEIQRTGCVWLSIWGQVTQPPVLVAAFKQEVIT